MFANQNLLSLNLHHSTLFFTPISVYFTLHSVPQLFLYYHSVPTHQRQPGLVQETKTTSMYGQPFQDSKFRSVWKPIMMPFLGPAALLVAGCWCHPAVSMKLPKRSWFPSADGYLGMAWGYSSGSYGIVHLLWEAFGMVGFTS